jgi:hypothetical protein
MTERRNQTSGFASMDRRKQREIARKGGMAAHRKGVAHEFTSEEARDAGRKGGQNVSANRTHMIEIGRLGGRRSAERRRNRTVVQEPGGSQHSSAHSVASVGVNSSRFGDDQDAGVESVS